MVSTIIRGNALDLPLADASVDLVVTSPPYFGLRSYQDGGEHYRGQIGAEPTPAEFVDALIAATREMVRVLKPSGSIWVNLGDKYANPSVPGNRDSLPQGGRPGQRPSAGHQSAKQTRRVAVPLSGIKPKSLYGIPWRYALRCIDDLGLILRAEVIWAKPNGLPESVTDRVRRSHEVWFHFTKEPRYYSAVDEIREPHMTPGIGGRRNDGAAFTIAGKHSTADGSRHTDGNPLGKLPGSVWKIPTQPLKVPPELGIDHFAAFPMEWPRRIIAGWSPAGVCTACGQGRRNARGTACNECGAFRPNNAKECPGCGHRRDWKAGRVASGEFGASDWSTAGHGTPRHPGGHVNRSISGGDRCDCAEPTAPTTPGVVLDPFGGTGTTALVADVMGRRGISVDMSADYCRLAAWRTNDPRQRERAARGPKPAAKPKPPEKLAEVEFIHPDQLDLFEDGAA